MTNTLRIRFFAIPIAVSLIAVWAHHSYADAPTDRYVIANGTVLDTKTQLTWEQIPSPDAFTWDEAQTHCKNIALDGSGWRAPSMKELQTIVDESQITPCIDTTAFTDALANQYWTSSPRLNIASHAWLIRFDIGDTNSDDVLSIHRVRCVR